MTSWFWREATLQLHQDRWRPIPRRIVSLISWLRQPARVLTALLPLACAVGQGDRPIAVVHGLKTIEPGTSSSRLQGQTYEEHFARCWEPPAAVERAPFESQGVEIQGSFGPDGSAIKVEIVNEDRVASDPVFRGLAESLRLAVERCGLPPMPPDEDRAVLRYVLTMKLDPSLMLAAR